MNLKVATRRRGLVVAAALGAAALMLPQSPARTAAAAADFGPQAGPLQASNWGGYIAQGTFTSISGSWTQPHVTCNSTDDLFAPWLGLDGFGSRTVEQTGVETDCSSGTPVLSAWYEMYPAPPVQWSDPVAEGDHITASVVSKGIGRYTLTLTDDTRGWTEHTDQILIAKHVSAEAVIESPTQSYPSFSRLDFSGLTVNGRPFDSAKPQPFSSGGYTPGPLSGGSFSLTPGTSAFTPQPPAKRPPIIRY